MKKLTKFILVVLSIFLFHSCKEKPPTNLGNNYFLKSLRYTFILDSTNVIIIMPQIVAWNYDSIFIIVKQKPLDEIYDSILMEHPNTPSNYQNRLYEECQIFNYWIIDKRKELDSYYDEKMRSRKYIGAVFGPLTYEAYWAQRKELDVPDLLKLKETERNSFPTPIHSLFHTWFYRPPSREREVD